MSTLPPTDLNIYPDTQIGEKEEEEKVSPFAFREILEKKEEEKPKTKEEKKKEALPSLFSIALPPQSPPSSPLLSSSTEITGVSLPPDFSEVAKLLETHVSTLTIKNEIATIKTIYQKEGSPFDQLEIFIDHYSSAPNQFHIELYGSPEAAKLLAAHSPLLTERLSSMFSGHHFHVARPFIGEEKSHYRREKKKEHLYIKKSSPI